MTDYATGTDHLLAGLEDGVLTLTLNRPEARNALSGEMLAALAAAIAKAELDPAVRCLVITGTGQGFCAGGDVKGMAARGDGAAGPTLDEAIHRLGVSLGAILVIFWLLPMLFFGALRGAAAGAGLAIALACDLRIMASTAVLTTAFARVGFSGDYGGTYFLTQLVGAAKARELYYLSDRVSAEEALRLGLTNWVVPPEQLGAKTREVALRLARGPAVALRYMKENLNRAISGGDIDDCLDLEATHHVHCAATEDHRDAARAFVEKREPVFHGR